jgi:hypothetical protein
MPENPPSGNAKRRTERAFVLRVWREAGARAGTLRGSIVELESGRRFFFTQLGDLKDFLRLTLEGDDF